MFLVCLFIGFREDEEPHPAAIMPFHCKPFFSICLDNLSPLVWAMSYRQENWIQLTSSDFDF